MSGIIKNFPVEQPPDQVATKHSLPGGQNAVREHANGSSPWTMAGQLRLSACCRLHQQPTRSGSQSSSISNKICPIDANMSFCNLVYVGTSLQVYQRDMCYEAWL